MGFKLIPKTQVFVHELGNFYTAFKTADPGMYAASITFPANEETFDKVYTLEVYANDKPTGVSIPLTIYSKDSEVEFYSPIAIREQVDPIGPGGDSISVIIFFRLDDEFISVLDITGIPKSEIKLGLGEDYELNLGKCKTDPLNATNRDIEWSLIDAGTTGAVIEDEKVKIYDVGTIVIGAIVSKGVDDNTDFTKEFNVQLQPVPVENITGIPNTFTDDEPYTLNGIVSPENARNQDIVWGVVDAGTTGATIEGNVLLAHDVGQVTISAEIEDGVSIGNSYYQEFVMTSEHAPHISVQDLVTDFPSSFRIGEELPLSGTVVPANAKNQNIVWTIASDSGTNAIIENGVLKSPIAVGTVTVRATIAGGICTGEDDVDYTKDFDIEIKKSFVAVTNITGVPTEIYKSIPVDLSVANVVPSDAINKNITWEIIDAGTTGATIEGNVLLAHDVGQVTISAEIESGVSLTEDFTQDFDIEVIVDPSFISVTDITGIPTSIVAGESITLSGDIIPSNATNQTIEWYIENPQGTDANIIGNILTSTIPGTITIGAYIENGINGVDDFNKHFDIDVIIASQITTSLFGDLGTANGKWAGGVLGPNGKIYGIPYISTQILEIDPINQTTSLVGNFPGSSTKWNYGVLGPNGKIYGMPFESLQILEFDPETNESNLYGNITRNTKYSHGVLAPNDKIYGIPYSHTQILEFDPITKDINLFDNLSNDVNKWSYGILAPNGKIYCIPYTFNQVLEIDPINKTTSLFGDLGTSTAKWKGGVLGPNGKIYGIPYNHTQILEIDPISQTTSLIGNLIGSSKWAGGVLGSNNKIYTIPYSSTQVLEFDPITKTTNLHDNLTGTLKWNGGVMGDNDKIYGIPSTSSKVLEISFGE